MTESLQNTGLVERKMLMLYSLRKAHDMNGQFQDKSMMLGGLRSQVLKETKTYSVLRVVTGCPI